MPLYMTSTCMTNTDDHETDDIDRLAQDQVRIRVEEIDDNIFIKVKISKGNKMAYVLIQSTQLKNQLIKIKRKQNAMGIPPLFFFFISTLHVIQTSALAHIENYNLQSITKQVQLILYLCLHITLTIQIYAGELCFLASNKRDISTRVIVLGLFACFTFFLL